MSEAAAARDLLRTLLREYNEQPDQRERIVAEIDRRFRRCVAVLVVDSCGFSRTVQAKGMVYFLALMERLERLVRPIIERHGGTVLRIEADNTFASFPEAATAVACAAAILHDLDAANELLPAEDEIYVSIGVGYGSALVVSADDLYGDEMNLACKLGEDLAGNGELLITPAAHAALGASPWRFEELHARVSGLDLKAYRLVR